MLCWQDVVYTEVCDPATHLRVPYGQRGTPVYTHLERTSQPMIRLESGDLTVWTNEPTPCGRTYPQLPMGIIGRIDDMITIRGENVYPSEIEAALSQLPGYGGEHRIFITREGTMDEIMISVEQDGEGWARGPDARAAFHATVAAQLRTMLGLRSLIEIVGPNTHHRTDFKARRVVDDRHAFAEMQARQSSGAS
jgi:phenylacetate-CoA ligase